MKNLVAAPALLLFLVSPLMAKDGNTCPVSGDLEHWRADYCMSEIGTDDVIAAQSCLEKEWKKVFHSACAGKLHYKRLMCEKSVKLAQSGSVKSCLRDDGFQGPTVRNSGV
jgi:hypothetical protein